MKLETALKWGAHWTIERWDSKEAQVAGKPPYSVSEIEGNVLLTEGAAQIWNVLIGGAAATGYFNATTAFLGVGGSALPAAAAAQTELYGVSTMYKGMTETYPSVAGSSVLQFKSEFASAEGNFAWEEFTVRHSGTQKNLNRLVSAQGTKQSGQVWTLTLSLSLA